MLRRGERAEEETLKFRQCVAKIGEGTLIVMSDVAVLRLSFLLCRVGLLVRYLFEMRGRSKLICKTLRESDAATHTIACLRDGRPHSLLSKAKMKGPSCTAAGVSPGPLPPRI